MLVFDFDEKLKSFYWQIQKFFTTLIRNTKLTDYSHLQVLFQLRNFHSDEIRLIS